MGVPFLYFFFYRASQTRVYQWGRRPLYSGIMNAGLEKLSAAKTWKSTDGRKTYSRGLRLEEPGTPTFLYIPICSPISMLTFRTSTSSDECLFYEIFTILQVTTLVTTNWLSDSELRFPLCALCTPPIGPPKYWRFCQQFYKYWFVLGGWRKESPYTQSFERLQGPLPVSSSDSATSCWTSQ